MYRQCMKYNKYFKALCSYKINIVRKYVYFKITAGTLMELKKNLIFVTWNYKEKYTKR